MKDELLTSFSSLGLAEPLLRALSDEGYETPTPIQAKCVTPIIEGHDLLGIAQTGTGKTAAFALPILHRLAAEQRRPARKTCHTLVLAPTRELAAQIAESFRTYGRHMRISVAVVVGGVGHTPQIQALSRGLDVLVATPGRLLDHLQSGHVDLSSTHMVVLDEADHMLDLGFIQPIRRIMRCLPRQRQTLMFSATMPAPIGELAADLLKDPVQVSVTPVATTAEKVRQEVYLVDTSGKSRLLAELVDRPEFGRTLVFTRTKRGADKVAAHLDAAGLPAAAIHGNKSQSQRDRALDGFKRGNTRILVATDIAARGIDVDDVTHVVNYDLPHVPEAYVHRIGRTARAGASGAAISFCDAEERKLLRGIEQLTRQRLPLIDRRSNFGDNRPAPAARPAASRPAANRSQASRTPSHRAPAGRSPGDDSRSRPQGRRRARSAA